jgi:hypothetical protein
MYNFTYVFFYISLAKQYTSNNRKIVSKMQLTIKNRLSLSFAHFYKMN